MDSILLYSFLPEFFLSLCILCQLLYGVKLINNLTYNYPIIDRETFSHFFFIILVIIVAFLNLKIEGSFSHFLFVNDESTRLVKLILIFSVFFIIHVVFQSFSMQNLNFFEYFVIFLLATFSLLLLISSFDLMSLYLLIEMQALCFYVLATFKRNSSFATESGLKYFIAGAFISGIFLLGASFIYGILGTLNMESIYFLLNFDVFNYSNEFNNILLIGSMFIIITFLFKIACAPFHYWAPDVYEGSPLNSTIILSIIPKIPLFYFLMKWLFSLNLLFCYDINILGNNDIFSNIQTILLLISAISLIWGVNFALEQETIKKLIIYSSISQLGFIVAGIAMNSISSNSAVFFFSIVYIITSILIWTFYSLFYSFQSKVNNNNEISTPIYISSLTNFFKFNKIWTFSLVIIFFSIAGIPPLSGFLSKILVIFEVVIFNNMALAFYMVVISAISVFYYIRIVKTMFFEPKNNELMFEKFQVVFSTRFFDGIFIICSFFLFLLLIIFFCPTSLLIFCQTLILSAFYI